MIFRYQEISPQIIRPIIQIVLKAKGKFVIYLALIDSGADYCIFNIQVAKELGIPLQSRKVSLKGIGREKVTGYLGKVEMSINGASYDLIAIFAQISDFGHGILGQKGFFDHFDVKLSYQKQAIELTKLKPIN